MSWIFVKTAASTTPWAPSDLADLRCWLDASDSATLFDASTGGSLPGNSGAVGRWEDKSGNSMHTQDATGSVRPTRVIAAQNGLDAINFASQGFSHWSSRARLQNKSSAIVAHVSKYNATTGGSYIWSHEESGNIKKRFQFGRFNLASQRLDSSDAAATIFGTSDGTSTGTSSADWHVHVGLLNWTNGSFEYRIDGTTKGTATYASGSGNTPNTAISDDADYSRVVIGITQRNSATFGKVPNGTRIGELLCFAKGSGTFSNADLEKVEGYLAHKWGLSLNLPVGHPYKNDAPTI